MFDNLTQRLGRVVKQLRGEARLTEANIQDALREVRLALLEADVALPVVKDFIARVREKAVGADVVGSLTPGQALIGVVHRELAALMGGAAAPLDLATQPPAVILLAGLQGAGKTTTAAKLARLLREGKKKVLVGVAFDEGRYLLDYRPCDPAADPDNCYFKLYGCYDDRDCEALPPADDRSHTGGHHEEFDLAQDTCPASAPCATRWPRGSVVNLDPAWRAGARAYLPERDHLILESRRRQRSSCR